MCSSREKAAQASILKVIEEKVIRRIGGNRNIPIAVRLIAATNIDLVNAVKNKKFREDLYYRLNIINIYIPPLRIRILAVGFNVADGGLNEAVDDFEKRIISEALKKCDYSRTRTAEYLKLKRTTLLEKMKRLQIQ